MATVPRQPSAADAIDQWVKINNCVGMKDPSGKYTPTNGEYRTDNRGGCGFLGLGKYHGYRRTAYYGDPYACCTMHPADRLISGKTCDAMYSGPAASACSPHFQTLCSSENNMTTNPDCAIWAAQYPAAAQAAMTSYCTENPLDPKCVSWAQTNPSALSVHRTAIGNYCTPDKLSATPQCRTLCQQYRGACNASVPTYCGQTTADPGFCSCLRSPAQGVAECIDNTCYQYGYKTTTASPTCDQTICSVYYDLKNVGQGIQFRDNVISQQCGQGPTPPEPEPDDSGNTDEDGEKEKEGADSGFSARLSAWIKKNGMLVMILLIIAVAIIAIVIAYYLTAGEGVPKVETAGLMTATANA